MNSADSPRASGFPNMLSIRRLGNLRCPDCQRLMTPFSCENVIVDKCGSCGGIWFDRRELGVFMNSLRKFDLSKIEILFKPPEPQGYHIGVCPRDDEALLEGRYSYNTEIRVYRCSACKGVWVPELQTVNLVEMAKISQAIEPDVKGLTGELKEYHAENKRFADMKRAGRELTREAPLSQAFFLRRFALALPLYVEGASDGEQDGLSFWRTGTAALVGVLFSFQLILPRYVKPNERLFAAVAMYPEEIAAGGGWSGLFTSLFVHAGWLALLINVFYLLAFGGMVEDRLGWKNYLGLFLVCGVCANLAQVAGAPASTLPVLGVGGALAGVMGAHLLFYPRLRITSLAFGYVVAIPAWVHMGVWLVLQTLISLTYAPEAGGGERTDLSFIVGFAVGAFLAWTERAFVKAAN